MKKLMEEHELIMNKEKTRYETELNQMEMKHKN